MALKTYKFDEEQIFDELTHLQKDGYCNIKAMPVFLFNNYRDIGILKCTECVNKWIVNRKIKHDQLVCIIDKYDEPHILLKSEALDICLRNNCTITKDGHFKTISNINKETK